MPGITVGVTLGLPQNSHGLPYTARRRQELLACSCCFADVVSCFSVYVQSSICTVAHFIEHESPRNSVGMFMIRILFFLLISICVIEPYIKKKKSFPLRQHLIHTEDVIV